MGDAPRSRPRRTAAALLLFLLPGLAGCANLPKLEEALANARAQAQSSKIFAADGRLLKVLHAEENRENIPLAQVPMHVREAVLAIEDARFYKHVGVDGRAILRAFIVNRQSGRVREGGSTITQQLVKNTLVGNERSLKRKVQEAALAYQLEQKYSKDQILEQYLNTVYYGEGAYGIEAAALTYFSKHARDLKLAEGALLAGLIRSPQQYSPFGTPKEALARRNVVLKRMLDERLLTPADHAKAVREPLGVRRGSTEKRYPAPYFVQYVEDLIQQDPQKQFTVLGKTVAERTNALFKGGLRIHTTVDLRLQSRADAAAREVMPYKSDPYNAFVAIDPKTGFIRAIRGGRDFFDTKDPYAKYNLATHSPGRQPGSSFKLFTLIAALEKGIPLSRYYRGGSSITLPIYGGSQYWRVRNYESLSFGSSLSLLDATVKSVNVVYAQVLLEVGAKAVVDVARRMGVTMANLDAVPSISLGSEEVTPLELATAYATLAAGGQRVHATPIEKITDAAGKIVWTPPKAPRKQVISPAVAAQATHALIEVVERGTGRREQIGERIIAGKTGTSEEYADAWFAGITPQMAGVTWVGFPKAQISMRPPRTRITVVGGSWPGRIWKLFMEEALRDLSIEQFPYTLADLVTVRVDILRNCLATGQRKSTIIVDKMFLKGEEPTKPCSELPPPTIGLVPNVVGYLAASATNRLKEAGFQVSTRRIYCPAYPSGYVCSQSPSADDVTLPGSTVTIAISDDSAVASVPMVLGKTLSQARAQLEAAGFTVGVTVAENDGTAPGCRQTGETRSGYVWLQQPCAGETAGAGSMVRITVNP